MWSASVRALARISSRRRSPSLRLCVMIASASARARWRICADSTCAHYESASVDTQSQITSSSQQGQYENYGELDFGGEHYGCALAFNLMGIKVLTFRLDYVMAGNVGHYVRCNPGSVC